jgi:hypothetical protein
LERFNVTLIQPDGYPHSQALVEAADYLADCIRRCGHESQRTVNSTMADAHNVIFCSHLLHASQYAGLPATTIIFNGEQLNLESDWTHARSDYKRLLETRFVWDYAAANLDRITHARKAQIPFYFSAALQRTDITAKPGNTLLFYGALTKRRNRIIERLKSEGLKVRALFNVYGDARDREIFNCWAVLNLHKSDESDLFEPIRCFYPLTNGIPVISETFRSDAMCDIYRSSMHVFETRVLAKEVAALARDRAGFDRTARAFLAGFAATDPLPHVSRAIDSYLATLVPAST